MFNKCDFRALAIVGIVLGIALLVAISASAAVDPNTKWDSAERCELYATAAVYNVQPQRDEGVVLKVALKHELDSLIPEFAPSAVPTVLIQEVTYASIFVYQNPKLKDNDLYLSYVFACKSRLAPHTSI